MKKIKIGLVMAVVVGACVTSPVFGQVADPAVAPGTSVSDGLSGFLVNLATQYPWLATALLIIGGLRVVFKPIMSLIDGYVKANCSADEYAKLQAFEAGPIYKWLSFGLDFVGSVKLPVIGVKPGKSN